MGESAFIHHVRAVVRRVEAEAGLDDLTMRSRYLLDLIGEHHAEPLRLSELIKLAQAGTPPSIYCSVDELERGGWASRTPDIQDRRAYRLVLTAKARRAFARMSHGVQQLSAKRRSSRHSIG